MICLAFCSDSVTHVVAENNSGPEVLEWLQAQKVRASSQPELLDVSWLIECMRVGKPVATTGQHQLLVSVLAVVSTVLGLMVRNMGYRTKQTWALCSRPV